MLNYFCHILHCIFVTFKCTRLFKLHSKCIHLIRLSEADTKNIFLVRVNSSSRLFETFISKGYLLGIQLTSNVSSLLLENPNHSTLNKCEKLHSLIYKLNYCPRIYSLFYSCLKTSALQCFRFYYYSYTM